MSRLGYRVEPDNTESTWRMSSRLARLRVDTSESDRVGPVPSRLGRPDVTPEWSPDVMSGWSPDVTSGGAPAVTSGDSGEGVISDQKKIIKPNLSIIREI